jgi:hypothetical protein
MTPLAKVKTAHTAVWAVLAGMILYLPYAALSGEYRIVLAISLVILLECVALGMNGGQCPLTRIAARYTNDRSDNFDIYLPLLIARHNKLIFGAIFACGELIALWRWLKVA